MTGGWSASPRPSRSSIGLHGPGHATTLRGVATAGVWAGSSRAPEALAVLLLAGGLNRRGPDLVVIVCFGLGLAVVLGLVVIRSTPWRTRLGKRGRAVLTRRLPVISAAVVVAAGRCWPPA